MSRVVVIGATGHIGSYLVPRLVRGGHEVIAMSRGTRDPYHASPQWNSVSRVTVDREAQDAEGTFGARVAALHPDVVIDLVCFTAASAQQLLDALRPSRPLLVHCGTIWVHGPALRVPVTEDEPRTAYGEYGTGKAEIEALLHRETLAGGVLVVVLLNRARPEVFGIEACSWLPENSRTSSGVGRTISSWAGSWSIAPGRACTSRVTPVAVVILLALFR